MNELTIAGKKYISSKRAAEITGYAKDYVGQLCREGYVEATMVGRSWYALESSIIDHRFGKESKDSVTEKNVDTLTNVEVSTPFISIVEESVEAPVYTKEEMIDIPVVIKTRSNTEYHVSPTQEEVSPMVDMQSAWQEWFSNKQSTLIESPDVIEERYEDLEKEALLMPLVIDEDSHKIAALDENVEETVVIRREFDAVRPLQAPVEVVDEETDEETEEDTILIHKITTTAPHIDFQAPKAEYKTTNTINTRSSNVVARATLISVAIVVVAISVIGSGLADKYLSSSIIQGNPVIKLIQGKSDLNK